MSSVSRTGDNEPVEDRETMSSDNHIEQSEMIAEGSDLMDNERINTSVKSTEVQRTNDGNTVCRRTSDKPRYDQGRRREIDKHISGKFTEAPRTGERNATKAMQGYDQDRRKEYRDNGRYHDHGGRELRDNKQGRYREQGRDWGMGSSYSGRSRGYPQKQGNKDQRSRSGGQPRWRGGRGDTCKNADSDSTNNQSVHRQYKVTIPTDGMKDAMSTASVKVAVPTASVKVAVPAASVKVAVPAASIKVAVPTAAAGFRDTMPTAGVKLKNGRVNQRSRTDPQDISNQRQRTTN